MRKENEGRLAYALRTGKTIFKNYEYDFYNQLNINDNFYTFEISELNGMDGNPDGRYSLRITDGVDIIWNTVIDSTSIENANETAIEDFTKYLKNFGV